VRTRSEDAARKRRERAVNPHPHRIASKRWAANNPDKVRATARKTRRHIWKRKSSANLEEFSEANGGINVSDWNDVPERTVRDVVALCRRVEAG
jgi:hypothetical protein